MTKALAMISGGLDSILAAKIIKDQGIDVIGICFKSYFFNEDHAMEMVKQIDIPLVVVDFSEEHMDIVKNPRHGYGKNMNPCIDCHTLMLNYTGKLLEKYGADFIITGEVLNQRPMSQNKASLNIVKNESGFSSKILRPLCAKNLEPTDMENEGIVDREKLFGISGRGRKDQIKLAKDLGIVDYPSPAGGCKLTDPNYSKRLKELLEHEPNPSPRELELLSIGRHFRVSPKSKIISTRTEEEGKKIKDYLNENDMIFLARDYNGSFIVIIGPAEEIDIKMAAKITARYCKGKYEKNIIIKYGSYGKSMDKGITTSVASEEELAKYII